MPIPPEMMVEIEKRRQSDIANLILSDQELYDEILAEQKSKAKPENDKPAKDEKKEENQEGNKEINEETRGSESGQASLGSAQEQLKRLIPIYQSLWGASFDPKEVKIPPAKPDFNRLIVVHPGLTLNQIVAGLRKAMKVRLYTEDLDKDVVRASYLKRPDPPAGGPHAIRVRDSQEADPDQKNRSADDLEEAKVNCLTLPERLLYEGIYWQEKKRHLDQKNWTLCAGSRCRDGCVPYVDWRSDDGELHVNWWSSGDRLAFLRARLAVS